MSSDSFSPRQAAAIGALALAPVVWYGLASSGTAGIVSAVNVVLIVAALFVAMSPVDTDHHSGTSA